MKKKFLKSGGEEMKNIKNLKLRCTDVFLFLKAMDSKVLKVMVEKEWGL